MITIEIKKGRNIVDKSNRASLLAQIEANVTTDQLQKLAELSGSAKARKKLDNSFTMIKKFVM